MGRQGEAGRGQEDRFILTPFHTSAAAWRGLRFCDPTGREHKKQQQNEHKKEKKKECIFILFIEQTSVHEVNCVSTLKTLHK